MMTFIIQLFVGLHRVLYLTKYCGRGVKIKSEVLGGKEKGKIVS